MTTLVVWDQCGQEPVQLYAATDKAERLALKCNGQYVNDYSLPEEAPVNKLLRLCFFDDGGNPRPAKSDFVQIKPGVTKVKFDAIVVCGFLP